MLLVGKYFFLRTQRVPLSRKHKLGTDPALSAPSAWLGAPAGQGGHTEHGCTPQSCATCKTREVTASPKAEQDLFKYSNIPTVRRLEQKQTFEEQLEKRHKLRKGQRWDSTEHFPSSPSRNLWHHIDTHTQHIEFICCMTVVKDPGLWSR